MSTTLYAHASGEARQEAPTVKISEYSDYVTLMVEQGGNEVTFFVHLNEDESMSSLLGRVLQSVASPKISLKDVRATV